MRTGSDTGPIRILALGHVARARAAVEILVAAATGAESSTRDGDGGRALYQLQCLIEDLPRTEARVREAMAYLEANR